MWAVGQLERPAAICFAIVCLLKLTRETGCGGNQSHRGSSSLTWSVTKGGPAGDGNSSCSDIQIHFSGCPQHFVKRILRDRKTLEAVKHLKKPGEGAARNQRRPSGGTMNSKWLLTNGFVSSRSNGSVGSGGGAQPAAGARRPATARNVIARAPASTQNCLRCVRTRPLCPVAVVAVRPSPHRGRAITR